MNLLNIKRREYKAPIQIRLSARSNINTYLRGKYGVSVRFDTVGKDWLITKGPFRGTMPKRVSSYLWKVHNIKLDKSDLSHIGNLSGVSTKATDKIEFEINPNLRWMRGDFGDPNSCFWSCHTAARLLLEDEGASAVKWYKNGKGFARAFILKYATDKHILFNAYGLTLTDQANWLCEALELHLAPIELYNHGSSEGDLYINNGMGFILSKDEEKAKKCQHTKIDLNMDFDDDWFNFVTCLECGDITDQQTYIVGELRICGNCYKNKCFCKSCSEVVFYSENHLSKIPANLEAPKDECFYCFRNRVGHCNTCGLIITEGLKEVHKLNTYVGRLELEKVCSRCCTPDKRYCAMSHILNYKDAMLEFLFDGVRVWAHMAKLKRIFGPFSARIKGLLYDSKTDVLTFDPNYYDVSSLTSNCMNFSDCKVDCAKPRLKRFEEINEDELESYKQAICERVSRTNANQMPHRFRDTSIFEELSRDILGRDTATGQ